MTKRLWENVYHNGKGAAAWDEWLLLSHASGDFEIAGNMESQDENKRFVSDQANKSNGLRMAPYLFYRQFAIRSKRLLFVSADDCSSDGCKGNSDFKRAGLRARSKAGDHRRNIEWRI